MDLSTESSVPLPSGKRVRAAATDLTQYINPAAQGRARQALQAHHGASYLDSYKTVMCQTWLETATCGFGANCKFAHGEAELRQSSFPPPSINTRKYKTRLCDKYTKKGICPYGRRCLFIHPEMPVDVVDSFRDPEVFQPTQQVPMPPSQQQRANPVPLFVPTAQQQQQQQHPVGYKERRSSLPCESPQPPSTMDVPWNSSTNLYLPPVPPRYHDSTPLFIPSLQTSVSAAHWGKSRERRSSVPCDPPQMPTLAEVPWTSTTDLQSNSPDNGARSQPIWSSHEDVFTTVFQGSPQSSNFSNSDSGHSQQFPLIMSMVNPLKQTNVGLDDSYGCLKDFTETLASSLANVLDLSDVQL